MTAFFLSALGYAKKSDGLRIPVPLPQTNGLLDSLRAAWPEAARILLIAAAPDRPDYTDAVHAGLRESFRLSGLPVSQFDFCDSRDESALARLAEYHVVILPGGHVPTQNAYHQRIALRERLAAFPGLLIAWSAGAMNCADAVYALPEREGEATDPAYRRFLPGLGLTQQRIIPHYDQVREDAVDGLRVLEDMALPDSTGRRFLCLCNGSYVLSCDGAETLHGEAYLIHDGRIALLCTHGNFLPL